MIDRSIDIPSGNTPLEDPAVVYLFIVYPENTLFDFCSKIGIQLFLQLVL